MEFSLTDALVWLALVGLGAGALTTLAGLGGGLFMTLILSAMWDPATALAVAAPALLVGNLQRVWMYRAAINPKLSWTFVAGAAPGALFGGFLAVGLPEGVLRWLLVIVAVIAVLREFGVFSWRPGPKSILPASFAMGTVTATTGGGGLLLGPLLLASGLRGEQFVATASMVALSVHITRIGAYGAGGLIDSNVLAASALLGLCIVVGNLAGAWGRRFFSEERGTWLTYAVLFTGIVCAVSGVR